MNRAHVYSLQNTAIHRARAELEQNGVLDPGLGIEQIRDMAGELNRGLRSVSSLSLEQRRMLIDRLVEMGARVRNPHIYASDLVAESAARGEKGPRKIIVYPYPSEEQLRMVDALAGQIGWQTPDGYARFCHKLFRAPRPRNGRELTRLRLALQSMIDQERVREVGL